MSNNYEFWHERLEDSTRAVNVALANLVLQHSVEQLVLDIEGACNYEESSTSDEA